MGLYFKTLFFQNRALPDVEFVEVFVVNWIQAVMAVFVDKEISELKL